MFLEIYLYNRVHTRSTDARSWIFTRGWVPGTASNGGAHALLDIYELIGPAAVGNVYRLIYPLRPPYGQPLSAECRQALVDQAPEDLKAEVAAKTTKM